MRSPYQPIRTPAVRVVPPGAKIKAIGYNLHGSHAIDVEAERLAARKPAKKRSHK